MLPECGRFEFMSQGFVIATNLAQCGCKFLLGSDDKAGSARRLVGIEQTHPLLQSRQGISPFPEEKLSNLILGERPSVIAPPIADGVAPSLSRMTNIFR